MQPDATQRWVHLRQKQCTWPVYARLPGISVNREMAATSPLAMLAMLDDPAMQWLAAQSFVTRKYNEPDAPLEGRSEDRPLRTKHLQDHAGAVRVLAAHPAALRPRRAVAARRHQWATSALRAHAANAGLDPARIVFCGRSTHAEFREKLTLADLYLDTYPYNAGSTARDVLDAQVPLVTLAGRTPVARMAGGLLHAAGLDGLIATSIDAYEELAVQLAGDGSRRMAIKEEMRRRAPEWRMAPARLARSLEEQLLQMPGPGAES